jgi:hypothetical protein
MYDFDSLLNYPDKDAMRDYENMSDKELIGMCIMHFIVLLAIVGVVAIVGIAIKLLF